VKPVDVDDLYELAPLQQGILWHCLATADPGVYVITLTYGFKGRLDRAALDRAWQKTMDRNPVLRTSFHWEDLKKPLQVVHHSRDLRCEAVDWRDQEEGGQRERLATFVEADRRRGFRLDRRRSCASP